MIANPPRAAHPEPIYFGPAASLFGVYHPPLQRRALPAAVVLCHPIGHEYFRVHRAFRNIAVGLSRLGFAALRFDYYGTGDSHDDASAATLGRWQADVSAALDEVERRSGLPRASVVGLRFGATLAWLAARDRTDVDMLVMWEPVVSGAGYFDRLRQLEHEWLTDPSRKAPADDERKAGSILGMRLGPEIEAEIRAVDLAADPLPARAHVVTLTESADAPAEPGWRERLVARYGARSYAALPSGADWTDPATVHTAAALAGGVQSLPALFDKVIV